MFVKTPLPNLICGECIAELKRIDDESIDLIVTDPPYRVTSRGSAGNSGGMLQKDINKKGQVFAHNNIDCSEYAPEFYRVLKDGSKGNKIMGQYYMSQFEYILFFRKGKGVKINNCGTSDILSIPNVKMKGEDGKNLHDTEKPIGLMEILIGNSSNENSVVLDPFMGIGSAGIACKNLGRQFIGIEIDDNYYQIAKHRISGN